MKQVCDWKISRINLCRTSAFILSYRSHTWIRSSFSILEPHKSDIRLFLATLSNPWYNSLSCKDPKNIKLTAQVYKIHLFIFKWQSKDTKSEMTIASRPSIKFLLCSNIHAKSYQYEEFNQINTLLETKYLELFQHGLSFVFWSLFTSTVY